MRVIGILPLRIRESGEGIGESVLFAFDIVKYRHVLFEEEAPLSHSLIRERIVDEIFVVCVNAQFTTALFEYNMVRRP
jgi:hypothetical protein